MNDNLTLRIHKTREFSCRIRSFRILIHCSDNSENFSHFSDFFRSRQRRLLELYSDCNCCFCSYYFMLFLTNLVDCILRDCSLDIDCRNVMNMTSRRKRTRLKSSRWSAAVISMFSAVLRLRKSMIETDMID